MSDGRAADRAGIPLLQRLQICDNIAGVISSVIDINVVMILLAGSGTEVLQPRQLAVHHDGTVMQSDGAGESADTACRRTHLFFIRKLDLMLRNAQSVDKLGHVQFPIAPDKGRHVSVFFAFFVICDKEQCLDSLRLIQIQISCDLFNGFCSRSQLFLKWQRIHVLLRRRIHARRPFCRRRHPAFVTVGDLTLADPGQSRKLMGIASADGTGVRLYRAAVQPTPLKNPGVGVVHQPIAAVQSLRVRIEGIAVLHDKFTAADQSKARSRLISVFGLNLIQHQGHLPIGGDVIADQIRENLLMSRSKAEVSAIAILNSPQFRSIRIPAPGLLPEFRRLNRRHANFLRAAGVHLFPDDLFDFPNRAPAHIHKAVDSGHLFPDHSGTQKQNVTRNFRLVGNLPQCPEMHL